MKDRKVWVIIGATEGLGPATISYLLSREQIIIDVSKGLGPYIDLASHRPDKLFFVNTKQGYGAPFISSMKSIKVQHGKIDIIVNNSAYYLLDTIKTEGSNKATELIESQIRDIGSLVRALLPFSKEKSGSRLINIPPRLCSTEEADPQRTAFMEKTRDAYLQALAEELSSANITTLFIAPGDKLTFV